MSRKSLSEAAMDVLNASRSGAAKEPMHTLADSGSGLDAVQDIGGATSVNPQGNEDIGTKSANGTPSATPPGTPPDAGSKDAIRAKTAGTAAAMAVSNQSAGKTVEVDQLEVGGGHDTRNAHKPAPYTGVAEDIEAARQERWDEIKASIANMSVAEDVAAMLSGQDLSEEFKTKVATIFEAAVLTRAIAVAEQLETQILEDAESAVEEVRAELEEKVDSYLNFVIENWVKENEVAIESGLKSEIVEGFLASLKNVFEENYIEVPEGKMDVLEAVTQKVQELESKLNEALDSNIELYKQLGAGQRSVILNKVCEGLTAVQSAKVKTLAEGVEFTTEGDYRKKLGMIRESYFPAGRVKQDETTRVVALTESDAPAQIEESTIVDPLMAHYASALDKFKK